MPVTRHDALVGLFAVTLLLATAVLFDVLATVFFAVTVAYLLVPIYRWLVDRGIPGRWASASATLLATAVVVVPVAIVGFILYLRFPRLVAVVRTLPTTVPVRVGEFTYTVELTSVLLSLQDWLSQSAVAVVREAPVVGVKLTLFAFLVYALVLRWEDLTRAVVAPVPARFRDVLAALDRRLSETLFVIYVLQVLTGVGTFLLALPVFFLLGYQFVVTLAFVCGVLQFLPIVGPSIVVVGLAVYQVAVGNLLDALLVAVLGGVFVAWLPDILIRPRFAQSAGHLPGSLYYVGFAGGLLTVGPVGIIAGPLAVALVAETLGLLAAENRPAD